MALVVLASLMAGMAIYLCVHKHLTKRQVAVRGSTRPTIADEHRGCRTPPLDADARSRSRRSTRAVRVLPRSRPTRRVALPPIDARRSPMPRRSRPPTRASIATRRRARCATKAQAALDEGDSDKALELADAVAQAAPHRAGVPRARAARCSASIASTTRSRPLDEATQLAPTYRAGLATQGHVAVVGAPPRRSARRRSTSTSSSPRMLKTRRPSGRCSASHDMTYRVLGHRELVRRDRRGDRRGRRARALAMSSRRRTRSTRATAAWCPSSRRARTS